jgi:hypothetical protein
MLDLDGNISNRTPTIFFGRERQASTPSNKNVLDGITKDALFDSRRSSRSTMEGDLHPTTPTRR